MSGSPGSEQPAGEALAQIVQQISQQRLPPVDQWQPAASGEIDIRIARNGDWFHEGSRIQRERLVKLFSTVLRADDDGVWLVTPQQKLKIVVEDAPFVAVTLEQHGAPDDPALVFTTNLGDRVVADVDHPIHVDYQQPDGEPSPHVIVRGRLRALIARQVFIELAGMAQPHGDALAVVSRGTWMPLGPLT